MADAKKIRLLNAILSNGSSIGFDLCAEATYCIERALADNPEVNLNVFAKNIIKLYDNKAEIEVVEIGEGGVLFALPQISIAVRRISGADKAFLVISGLKVPPNMRSKKKWNAHFSDVDTLEGFIMRYQSAFPNIEVIFI